MNPTLAKTAKHFLAGMLAAAWNGAIGSVAGILGIDSAAMAGVPNVQVLDWRGMASAFIGAFVVHGIFWLKAHPLPETYDNTAPFFPPPKNPGAQPPSLPNQ
jgi:hypothetical protein